MQKSLKLTLCALIGVSSAAIADNALIVFGNGVNTTEEKSRYAHNKLRELVKKDTLFRTYDLDFDYSDNQTTYIPDDGDEPGDSCIRDILESVGQVLFSTDYDGFWRYYSGIQTEPTAEYLLVTETANSTPVMLLGDSISLLYEDLVDQVTRYKESVAAGKKVLLVAHPQGNLFGNEVFSFLTPTEQASFGMVSVATPTIKCFERQQSDHRSLYHALRGPDIRVHAII